MQDVNTPFPHPNAQSTYSTVLSGDADLASSLCLFQRKCHQSSSEFVCATHHFFEIRLLSSSGIVEPIANCGDPARDCFGQCCIVSHSHGFCEITFRR